jgi:hypothetical protein
MIGKAHAAAYCVPPVPDQPGQPGLPAREPPEGALSPPISSVKQNETVSFYVGNEAADVLPLLDRREM